MIHSSKPIPQILILLTMDYQEKIIAAAIQHDDFLISTSTNETFRSIMGSYYETWMSPIVILMSIVLFGLVPSLLVRCCCHFCLADFIQSRNKNWAARFLSNVLTVIVAVASCLAILGAYEASDPVLRDFYIGASIGGLAFSTVVYIKSDVWINKATTMKDKRFRTKTRVKSISRKVNVPIEPISVNIIMNKDVSGHFDAKMKSLRIFPKEKV